MKRFFITLLVVVESVGVNANNNDYPTLERVDHVLTCMRLAGGQTVDNLYACSCEIDVIARAVNFEDFNEARTFEIYQRMPGEKGAIFRENERGVAIRKKLADARQDARKRCFIGVNRKSNTAKSASKPVAK